MGLAELFLIAVGLSMDAFAVSVCKGLGMNRLDLRQAGLIAVFFGGFQALMPALGWILGAQFAQFVDAYAHWIAFALLAFIGGKMIIDGVKGEDAGDAEGDAQASAEAGGADVAARQRTPLAELTMLAVATSIDAFAVGVTFAFLNVAVGPSCALIGVTTFCLSFVGVAIGHQFGARWERPSTIAGGIVLVAIGVKTLLEGLGLL